MNQLLAIFGEYGLKIHFERTELFLREASFCGRDLSGNGLKFDPRHFESLLHTESPMTSGDHQRLLSASNWIRTFLSDYAETTARLHIIMEIFSKMKAQDLSVHRENRSHQLMGRTT